MLKLGKNSPLDDEIEKATNENNLTEDWALIMQICDYALNYQDGAKLCFKAIMKRLHHNVPCVVLQALTLLDACVKNCDKQFLLHVASNDFITEARKLLARMHPTAALKLKELVQKWALEEFKTDSELCIIPSFYYKLKSEGVEFPPVEQEKRPAAPVSNDPNVVTSEQEENDIIKALEMSLKDTGRYPVLDSEAIHGGTALSSKVLPEPFKVRALYDFEAAEDNELTIKAGELLLVLDDSNESWWKGSNHLGEGLFPANFATKDIDLKPEEDIAVFFTSENVQDTTFTGEVKIDEKKIETVINWLNETDPTVDTPDPADMLRLEDEVYKMNPLIEERIQFADKRLELLKNLNETIMEAFGLFHSLSAMPSNMEYAYGASQMPQGQIQPISTNTMQPNLQTLPMMYAPMPPGQQYFMMTGQPNNTDNSTEQSQAQVQPLGIFYTSGQPPASHYVNAIPQPNNTESSNGQQQVPEPNNTLQDTPVESTVIDQSSNVAISASVSAATGNQPAAVIGPYGMMNNMGGYYMPSVMPLPPLQYQSSQMNLQQPGCIQPPGVSGNLTNASYPVPQMAPYMPFPYYYMPGNLPPVPSSTLATSTQNPKQGNSTSVTNVNSSSNPVTSIPVYPAYASNIQTLAYHNVITSTKEQSENQQLSSSSDKASCSQLVLQQM